MDTPGLTRIARAMRADILKMTTAAGSGHPGGSLSAADIVAAIYFSGLLRHNPQQPDWPERDRFILSKAHVAPVLYAALARAGYLPLAELASLRRMDSRLQGHPDHLKLPGVEVSGGSLGQGLSIAAGLAYALLCDQGWTNPQASPAAAESANTQAVPTDGMALGAAPFVFTLLGDGECQEGQVWEAAMFAAHYRLTNLIAIIDMNGLQIDGRTADVMDLGSIAGKFGQFGWQVVTIDGHDMAAVVEALRQARQSSYPGPRAIVAQTVKGKGISFMEGQAAWHGKVLDSGQLALALAELEAAAIAEEGPGTDWLSLIDWQEVG